MPIKRLATQAEVFAQIDSTIAVKGNALFLCFGSEDPVSGESWCPDCVTADPVLRSACASLRNDIVLYECPVGQRSAWKNQPTHPYRIHPLLRISRIPTLVFIENGVERGRLVEGDCAQPQVVAAFLSR